MGEGRRDTPSHVCVEYRNRPSALLERHCFGVLARWGSSLRVRPGRTVGGGRSISEHPPRGGGGGGGGRAQTTPLPLPYIALPPTQTVLDLRCNGPYVVKSKFAVHIITSAVLTYIIARQQVATSAHSHAQYDSALQGHALG